MPDRSPFPGEQTRPRDGAAPWFEPDHIASAAVENSAAAADGPVLPLPELAARQDAAQPEICWVGFLDEAGMSGEADTAALGAPPAAMAEGAAAFDQPMPAATLGPPGPPAVTARPPSVEEALARRGVVALTLEGLARCWRWTSTGLGSLLRLAIAAAVMGAVAVLAYQGGEHLAALTGDTTTAAAPGPSAAAVAAPTRDQPRQADQAGSDAAPGGAAAKPGPRAAYYLDRARAGDAVAQYNLAVLYLRGDGLTRDFSSAAAWFREAAAAGHAAAQFNLAVMYERGLGVAQNPGEAIAWYRRAAEQNYPPAQYNLAQAYAEGRGTAVDAVAEAGWYRRAAMQGLVAAMVNSAILYERGEGVEHSVSEAYAWYRAAARAGDGAAERRARELFQQFNGAEKGKAVMAAAAVAGEIGRPGAPPEASSPKIDASDSAAVVPKPAKPTGRSAVPSKPARAQPAG